MLFVKDFLSDQIVYRSADAPICPLVSVVLPTYARFQNGFLKRAMDSVLGQTFIDLELIVVDDGSTDGSCDYIEQRRLADPRVVHVCHRRNSGLPGLRVNEGIELARGRYVSFQFDDDSWKPQALEFLVQAATQNKREAVIVGKTHFHWDGGEFHLPSVPVNLTSLYQENRIANNSVLVPRALFDTYGMYDCHLAMRRLTDWDLWLRLIAHVPFIFLDQVVTDVYAGNPDAIGMTVAIDLSLFRYLHDFPRNHLLRPSSWREYEIDWFAQVGTESQSELIRRLYEQQLVPYYVKFRHHFPQLEGFSATIPSFLKNVAYTRGTFDASNYVCLQNYDHPASRRSSYKLHYRWLPQLTESWVNEVDGLVLLRVTEGSGKDILAQGVSAGRPLAYCLDDDLLTLHEYGKPFENFAPGAGDYENAAILIGNVDAVWVTNQFIAESVLPFNPRVLELNNCISPDFLPAQLPFRDPQRRIKIGCMGNSFRLEELSLLWEGFQEIAKEFSDRVTFEFWGFSIETLPSLKAPTKCETFNLSYLEYLSRLRDAQFDILITPLLDYPRPRLGKSLVKYYETAVAGAVGIFSDVPQYGVLPENITCLKAGNNASEWHKVLTFALTMPSQEFDRLRGACLQHVRENFTSVSQVHQYEAAWCATEFHAKTRGVRNSDGRPRVLYVLTPEFALRDQAELLNQIQLMRGYGIDPVVLFHPLSPEAESLKELRNILIQEKVTVEQMESYDQKEDVGFRQYLEALHPVLVHTWSIIPSVEKSCLGLDIPHVFCCDGPGENSYFPSSDFCTIHYSDNLFWATRFNQLLESEKFCFRGVVPEQAFDLGLKRRFLSLGASDDAKLKTRTRLLVMGLSHDPESLTRIIDAIRGAINERVEICADIYMDSHVPASFLGIGFDQIKSMNLNNCVSIHEYNSDLVEIIRSADILVWMSASGSLPYAIKIALACGVLVVAPPLRGISEIICDKISGILCADFTITSIIDGIYLAFSLTRNEKERILEQARRVARSEFHPQRAAYDLIRMYNRAIDLVNERKGRGMTSVAISKRSWPDGFQDIVDSPPHSPQGHIWLHSRLRYQVLPKRPNWAGIEVLVGTHYQKVRGVLRLVIYSDNNRPLRSATFNLEQVGDNSWASFRFSPIVNAEQKRFILEFRVITDNSKISISLYESHPLESKFLRIPERLGMSKVRKTLYCRMVYSGAFNEFQP